MFLTRWRSACLQAGDNQPGDSKGATLAQTETEFWTLLIELDSIFVSLFGFFENDLKSRFTVEFDRNLDPNVYTIQKITPVIPFNFSKKAPALKCKVSEPSTLPLMYASEAEFDDYLHWFTKTNQNVEVYEIGIYNNATQFVFSNLAPELGINRINYTTKLDFCRELNQFLVSEGMPRVPEMELACFVFPLLNISCYMGCEFEITPWAETWITKKLPTLNSVIKSTNKSKSGKSYKDLLTGFVNNQFKTFKLDTLAKEILSDPNTEIPFGLFDNNNYAYYGSFFKNLEYPIRVFGATANLLTQTRHQLMLIVGFFYLRYFELQQQKTPGGNLLNMPNNNPAIKPYFLGFKENADPWTVGNTVVIAVDFGNQQNLQRFGLFMERVELAKFTAQMFNFVRLTQAPYVIQKANLANETALQLYTSDFIKHPINTCNFVVTSVARNGEVWHPLLDRLKIRII